MIVIRDIVSALMLSLRRRYLERYIDGPFNHDVSRELDAAIVEQEKLREDMNPAPKRRRRE